MSTEEGSPRPSLIETGRLIARYLFGPRKTIVLIACTMRSGSTLLKAILGSAPDVSHLPEIPFHHLHLDGMEFYLRFAREAPESIIVLKHPLWFTDSIGAFPVPQVRRVRMIALVRDCYPTLCSVKAMPGQDTPGDAALVEYWVSCTTKLLVKAREAGDRGRVVRYEDLVADPVAVSASLFRFIGSRMRGGLSHYRMPQHEWKWGSDDGGNKIRSLEVQAESEPAWNPDLFALVDSDERVARLRAELGYAADYRHPFARLRVNEE